MVFLIQNLVHASAHIQEGTLAVAGIVAGAGVLSSVIGGIFGGNAAKAAAQQAAKEKAAAMKQLNYLEKNRQAIINPYSGTVNLSGMAKDLSGMASNTFANLGVATQAAKFQAEQTDMALASTLDTLKETGASAGGATALAQAALQSKQGISASIESQEAANEKLKAEGQQQLQQIQMSEAGRIQGLQISEAERMQQADVAGKQFVYGQTEARQQGAIDRVSGQASAAANRQAQANADKTAATAGMISGIGSAVGGFGSAAVAYNGTKGTTTSKPNYVEENTDGN